MADLRLREKYDLIHSHEEQMAYRLAREVINKPEVSVWMILVPILFLHHIYRINQYKAGVHSFAEGMLDPKRKALDKAYLEAGEKNPSECGLSDYFPELVDGSEQQQQIAHKQIKVIRIMQEHYRTLLTKSGRSYEEILRRVYSTSGAYRTYLARLEQAEKELYAHLNKEVYTSEEARAVIKRMEDCSRRMREDELRYLF